LRWQASITNAHLYFAETNDERRGTDSPQNEGA